MIKSSLNGIGLNKTQFIGTRHTCVTSEKMEDPALFIAQAFIDIESEKKSVRISFGDEFRIAWSPNIHILIHESLIEIIANVQAISPPATPAPLSPTGIRAESSISNLVPVSVSVDSPELEFCFQFNHDKRIEMNVSKMRYSWQKSVTEVSIDTVQFRFDQHTRSDELPLVNLSKATIRYTLSDSENSRIRQEVNAKSPSTFITLSNRLLHFSTEKFIFYFPFGYRAYPTFDQAVASFKMVKNLYKNNSEPFNPKSRFPFDLRLSCKELKVHIQDDPFEVKLAAVFTHKKEEWHEQVSRQKILHSRIAEFKANGQSVDTEELQQRLEHVNTTQYIKQVQSKKREKKWFKYNVLFAWELDNFDLTLLVDQGMYGYERVAQTILQIDPDLKDMNPWDYTTLWARYMVLSASKWIMKLRDYPRELIKADILDWKGILCGAEQRGNDDVNFRTNVINPGTYFDNLLVPRNLAPLKFYHDIEMNYQQLDLCWGPCVEAAWSEAQLAIRSRFISHFLRGIFIQ